MQNETKISSENINSIFQMLRKNGNNRDSIKKVLSENLTEEQKQTVRSITSDPQKLREVLSSPQAKALFEKFSDISGGEKKNGDSRS